MTPLFVEHFIHEQLAKQYAERFALTLVTEKPQTPFLAFYREQLSLFLDEKQKPLSIDWLQHPNAFQNSLLLNAIGKTTATDEIWDATAGFCKDAMTFLFKPMQVRCFERSPWMAALIADAQLRASLHPQFKSRFKAFRCEFQDCRTALENMAETKPEVIYLDPMFETHGDALPKQSMQHLRQLLATESDDGASLLETAIAQAIPRIVVKRAKHAPFLNERKPNLQLMGERVRFDVYVL